MNDQFTPEVSVVYRHNGSGMVPWGSCLLVHYGTRYWIFSASHVLTEKTEPGAPKGHTITPIWLPGPPGAFQPLEGELVQFSPEKLDLAFLELSPLKAEAVMGAGHRFLPLSSIRVEAPHGGPCLVTGYPAILVEPDGIDNTISVTEFCYKSLLLAPIEMAQAGLDNAFEVAVDASQMTDDITGKRVAPLDLRGLSGGVIWVYEGGFRLAVAIVTDHYPGRNLIIGTRITWLLRRLKAIEARAQR